MQFLLFSDWTPGSEPIRVRTMEKKVARVLKEIRHVRGLSEDEKYLFARSLAATPDERWRLHENFLRSHGLYTRSDRRKYGFK